MDSDNPYNPQCIKIKRYGWLWYYLKNKKHQPKTRKKRKQKTCSCERWKETRCLDTFSDCLRRKMLRFWRPLSVGGLTYLWRTGFQWMETLWDRYFLTETNGVFTKTKQHTKKFDKQHQIVAKPFGMIQIDYSKVKHCILNIIWILNWYIQFQYIFSTCYLANGTVEANIWKKNKKNTSPSGPAVSLGWGSQPFQCKRPKCTPGWHCQKPGAKMRLCWLQNGGIVWTLMATQ